MPLIAATEREMLRRIWALSWPMMLINGLEAAAGLADLLLIRAFGPVATAAVGVSRQVTFLVEALAVAVTAGAITLMSQGVGAARRADSHFHTPFAVVSQSLRLAVLLAVPTALAGYLLSGPLLSWLQLSDASRTLGEPYLQTYFAGLVFTLVNLTAIALFRGAGDVWTPLKVALCVSVTQLLLSYLFIHGVGPMSAFGVPGAALGAVVARGGGMVAFLYLLWRGRTFPRSEHADSPPRNWLGFDWALISQLLRVGVPMALANVLRHGSRIVFLAIVGASALGAALQASAGVGLQVRLISIVIALAFQTATATLVGQAIGQADVEKAEALGWRSIQLLAVLMLVSTLVCIVVAGPLAELFIADLDVARLGTDVLRWFAIAQFFSAVSIGTQGALMGAGDTLPALRYTLISEWCLLLPAAGLLVWLEWLPDPLLAAWALAPALTMLLMQRRFRSGRWKAMLK